MKTLAVINISIAALCFSCQVAHAKEKFSIKIAVEFTDHAASAYIARQKGWFEDEGIKPEFYSYVTGMSLAAALGRGDIQAAYLCLLPAINARANAGVQIKIVAGTHKYGYALTVNPEKIITVKDLEKPGIRIGSVQKGGPVDAVFLKTIEKYGLDRNKILNKVQRMNPAMQIMAVRMGKLDASFAPEHWPAMAEEEGFKILLTAQDIWPLMQGSVLIVKEDLIKNNPEIVKKLVRITEKSTDWIRSNPRKAARIMASELQMAGDKIFPIKAAKTAKGLVIKPGTLLKSMKRLKYTTDIDIKTIKETIEFAVRQDYIREKIDANDIIDLRFLNEK
ncbi:MAG: ABC transporter substrate-binding protein [Bacteroidales bacterium]|nr:ABC transporter substrate-binding protein [Bacteroidales bacterium]